MGFFDWLFGNGGAKPPKPPKPRYANNITKKKRSEVAKERLELAEKELNNKKSEGDI